MNTVYVSLRWRDLIGTPAKLSEIIKLISAYDKQDLLKYLCRISYAFSQSPLEVNAIVRNVLFSPQLKLLIDQEDREPGSPVFVVSRLHLVNLIKLVLLYADGDDLVRTPESHHQIGELLLKIADIGDGGHNVDWQPGQDIIDIPSDFCHRMLARASLEGIENFRLYFGRYHSILFRFFPDILRATHGAKSARIDFDFLDVNGIDIRDRYLLCFIVALFNEDYTFKSVGERQPGFDIGLIKRSLRWSDERFEKAIKHLAADIDVLVEELYSERSVGIGYEFRAIQRYPLLRVGDEVYVLDREFLLQSLGENLLALLENSLSEASRSIFSYPLGHAVENYAHELLSLAKEQNPEWVRRLGAPNTKAADFIIDEGATKVVVEVTIGLFRERSRYSRDPKDLSVELKRLLKELDQILYSVMDLCNGNNPPAIIVPVLVGLERTLGAFFIQNTLQQRFHSKITSHLRGKRPKSRITRLVCMSMEDLEHVCASVEAGYELKDILHACIAEDPGGYSTVRGVMSARGITSSASFSSFERAWQRVERDIVANLREKGIDPER